MFPTDYDEEDGEIPDEKPTAIEQQSSSTEINNLSEKLGKVMEDGEMKESDTEEGEMKDSDMEEGEIKEEGEEGEILSDDEVRILLYDLQKGRRKSSVKF
jgi:hypothetical protein